MEKNMATEEQANTNDDLNKEIDETTQPFKSFETESELDSFTDSKIAKALETAKSNWEKELDAKLQERESKATQLAKMSEKERQEQLLKDRADELDRKEKAIQMQEYAIEARKQLSDNGLPSELVDMVLSDDVEETGKRVQLLAKHVNSAIDARLQKLSAQDVPGVGTQTGSSSKSSSLAEIAKKNRIIK